MIGGDFNREGGLPPRQEIGARKRASSTSLASGGFRKRIVGNGNGVLPVRPRRRRVVHDGRSKRRQLFPSEFPQADQLTDHLTIVTAAAAAQSQRVDYLNVSELTGEEQICDEFVSDQTLGHLRYPASKAVSACHIEHHFHCSPVGNDSSGIRSMPAES